jgi:predicted regulator of Ras-like GTPase activity (Roadblock/LC7/MglB family)
MLLADGTNKLELSKRQFCELQKLIDLFRKKSEANLITIVDSSGVLVAKSEENEMPNIVILASLAAANYSVISQMAQIIGESDGFCKNYYEGEKQSLYIEEVCFGFFFVIVFDEKTTFGMVRVQAQKFKPYFEKVLNRADKEEIPSSQIKIKESFDSAEFSKELSSRLDDVLKG